MQLMIESLGTAMLKMDMVSRPTTARNVVKAAPFEGAITLRMAEAVLDKDEDRILRINYHLEHLRKGEVQMLPPIMQSFYRQTAEGVQNPAIGVSPITDKFVRTWMAFDPGKESSTKLQVYDHQLSMAEARKVFTEATQGIFDD